MEKRKSSAKKPGDLRDSSRSKSPGPRRGSPKPMHEQPCWNWQKGICKFGDKCKRQHQAAPAAKQEPKGKAKPKPAAPAYFCQAGYEDVWDSSDGGGYDVEIDEDKIGARLMHKRHGSSSRHCIPHDIVEVTIPSIMRGGLVPGGIYGSGRSMSHFA